MTFIVKYLLLSLILLPIISCQSFYNNSDLKSKENIIAYYDNGYITIDQAKSELNNLAQKNEELKNIKFENLTKYQKELIIKEIIIKEASYKEAKKRGLHKRADYQKLLKEFEMNLLQEKLILDFQEQASNLNNLKNEYNKLSKNLYGRKDYDISYIIVENKELSYEIYYKLLKYPKLFAQEAKIKSLDKDISKNGGNLGFILEDALPNIILDKIRNLKESQISKPFLFSDKWMIVKFNDKRDAKIATFKDAKKSLIKGITIKNLQDFKAKSIDKANINMVN
ncbi:peptidylprolyl isomerase [Rickettsiales bacterium]|nr:peptidylprolyl isomerase [Rickettsiales bacterium]